MKVVKLQTVNVKLLAVNVNDDIHLIIDKKKTRDTLILTKDAWKDFVKKVNSL